MGIREREDKKERERTKIERQRGQERERGQERGHKGGWEGERTREGERNIMPKSKALKT